MTTRTSDVGRLAPDIPYAFADRALGQRLERAEGAASAAFVESRARLAPATGARWIEVAGAYAMFDGPESPLTQTFGLGMFAEPTPAALDALEAFFHGSGADVHHEVSPLADPAVLPLLTSRGYQPIELTSVMHQPIASRTASPVTSTDIRARVIARDEEPIWADTAARGWSEHPELIAFIREMGEVSAHARGTRCFLAERRGVPIAAAGLTMKEGVALLAGASTIPEWRGRGAQAALLAARLAFAAEQGCDLAMMGAQPGSASQRNAERQGFRIAYTRIKWRLPRPA